MTIEDILKGETATEEFKNRMIQKSLRLKITNAFDDVSNCFTDSIVRFVTEMAEGNFYCNGIKISLDENDLKEVISCLKNHCKQEVGSYKNFISEVFGETNEKEEKQKTETTVEIVAQPVATSVQSVSSPTYFGY